MYISSTSLLVFASVKAITLTRMSFKTWCMKYPIHPPFQFSNTKHSGTAVSFDEQVIPGVYCRPIDATFCCAAGLLTTNKLSINFTLIVNRFPLASVIHGRLGAREVHEYSSSIFG